MKYPEAAPWPVCNGCGWNQVTPPTEGAQKKVGVYSPKAGRLPKEKELYWSKEFTYLEKTGEICLLPFIRSRVMHSNYQEIIISSLTVYADNTNVDFSNNNPLKVVISTHSKAL